MIQIRPLSIAGAWEIIPLQRGAPDRLFLEVCRFDDLPRSMEPAQVSLAVSARGGVRGIHYTAPPGQAKLVTCVAGAIFDVVVDLRPSSPTFGSWVSVLLDDVERHALYIAPGLGHGYCAMSDRATMMYLVAPAYAPELEREIYPFDGHLSIGWPPTGLPPDLSDRDRNAPAFRSTFPHVAAAR